MHQQPLRAPLRIEQALAQVRPPVREAVASIIEGSADALAEIFYSTLVQDQEAMRFLSHKLVGERLHRSLRQWLTDLFVRQGDDRDAKALIERQVAIGEAHARMRIPIHLVMQGADLLKSSIFERLQATELSRDELWEAVVYTTGLMDCAIEVMSQSFVRNAASRVQMDEAYRLFSLGQDISLDREAQRAVLVEWSMDILFRLHRLDRGGKLPPISRSEFGLWLRHRAGVMFQGSANLDQIQKSVEAIDKDMLPALAQAHATAPGRLPDLLEEFQSAVIEIKFLLADMFNSVAAIENGRDPLTRALNRRFLPSILSREISIASKSGSDFAIVLLDVDHFKRINDTLGHQAGDNILRQIADALLDVCRSSDFVFRYGGEEFLVAMVETDADAAFRAAERIRLQIETRDFRAPDQTLLPVTVSVGVASFDGHPDYSYLIEAADRALYTAKRSGRNRTVSAEQVRLQNAG